MERYKIRGYVFAVIGLLSGTVAAQAITEFSAGITAGAQPFGITAGPDGNLWFTERGGNRIGRITPAGVVTEFSAGISEGAQLSEIAAGADGNLWFAEQTGSRIGRITPDGFVTEFSAGITAGAQPFGITAGPDGNLWFTDQATNRVGRITPGGEVTQFSAGISAVARPFGIAAGANGNVWFTEPTILQGGFSGFKGIGQITPSGAVTEYNVFDFMFDRPSGIAAGPDGNVWFANIDLNNILQIGRIAPSGGGINRFSAGKSKASLGVGITAGPDGNLWFVDNGAIYPDQTSDRIGRVTPDGVVTDFHFGPIGHPLRIAAGPDGNLWFTKLSGHEIGRITPTGVVTAFGAGIPWGSFADAITAGPDGNTWFTDVLDHIGWITPAGEVTQFSARGQIESIITGPDGNLWFTEVSGNRIGRIAPNGDITEFSVGISDGALPRDIVAGPDGNLWFTEPGAVQIGRITPAGVITEFSAGITGGARPGGITRGPDGNLWFTEGRGTGGNEGGIGRITPDGVVTEFISPFSDGWQLGNYADGNITSGPDGNVWFTEWNSPHSAIGRITPDGVVTHFSVGDQPVVGVLGGIATGPDGNLWFADEFDHIGRITPEGAVTLFSSGSPGLPVRITTGPDGNLWFTESNSDRIGRITTATSVVEFYNASLDHYFITWMADEIAKLDAGTEIKGWVRTGYSFKVYTIAQSTTSPICRYYIPPQLGDSHFFGRGPDECTATGHKFPSFVLEDQAFMQMLLPTAGVCPTNTTPVYRVFSNRADANHRYMTDRSVRDQMVAKGWLAEGDGPDLVVMCAPQ